MLSHPWSADLARNAIRVFLPGELEDQDQMCRIDLRNASRERPRIDNKLHTLPRCLPAEPVLLTPGVRRDTVTCGKDRLRRPTERPGTSGA